MDKKPPPCGLQVKRCGEIGLNITEMWVDERGMTLTPVYSKVEKG